MCENYFREYIVMQIVERQIISKFDITECVNIKPGNKDTEFLGCLYSGEVEH